MNIFEKLRSAATGYSQASADKDIGGGGGDIVTVTGSRAIGGSDAINYGKDGNALTADDIMAHIKGELERRKQERRPYELQWILNSNFLSGHQNCEIRVSDNTIQDVPPLHDCDSHEVFNCIKPLYDTRVANLMSVNYDMTVKPATNELDDYQKAQISTKLLRYTQSHLDFQHIKDSMIHYVERFGNCFVMSWWDASAGDIVAHIALDKPDDDSDAGTLTVNTDIHEGDLAIGIISPFELYADNLNAVGMELQRSIIIDQIMDVERIYDIYGVDVDGHECDAYVTAPRNGAGDLGLNIATFAQVTTTVKNSEHVLTYFERASRRYPRGRFAVMIGDNLIKYSELPYDDIPITVIKCKEETGCFYGKSIVDELIPLQRSYNGVKNHIHDYFKHAVDPVLLVPNGSLPNVDDYRDRGVEPGEVIPYNPASGGSVPHWLDYPDIPGGLAEEAAQLKADMEYSAGVSQLMVYGQVANGTSGKAIESRRQIDSTRMSLTAENIRNAVIKMSKLWLAIYKRYASGNRTLRIVGDNDIGNAVVWCREDITSFDIRYDTENELKNSEENQKQTFMEALQLGLFTDENGILPQDVKRHAIKVMKVGNYSDTLTADELQKHAAQRENSYFDCGVIPQFGKYDDHAIHVEEHMKYIMQMSFDVMKRKNPQYAGEFEAHVDAHLAQLAASVNAQKQNAALATAQSTALQQPKTNGK